jgi:hypothetical protein
MTTLGVAENLYFKSIAEIGMSYFVRRHCLLQRRVFGYSRGGLG